LQVKLEFVCCVSPILGRNIESRLLCHSPMVPLMRRVFEQAAKLHI
jgi:hypothetical protein